MIDYGHGAGLDTLNPDPRCIEVYRQWRNDPRIRKWCRQNDLISPQAHAAWFERQAQDPTIRMYELLDAEKQTIGVCGLTSIDMVNRRAEFSLYVAPPAQRNGYGRKGLQTLFDHGFQALGLNSIWGETFDGNPAIKLFESLGMKREGTRREFYYREGRYIDAHLYSVLRSEWGQ